MCVCVWSKQAQLRLDGTLIGGDTISPMAARHCLRHLGMDLVCPKKGTCKDGHERADIKACRIEEHCKPIAAMSSRIRPVQAVAGCEAKRGCACNGKGCVELGPATLSQGNSEVIANMIMVFHGEVSTDHWIGAEFCTSRGTCACPFMALPIFN